MQTVPGAHDWRLWHAAHLEPFDCVGAISVYDQQIRSRAGGNCRASVRETKTPTRDVISRWRPILIRFPRDQWPFLTFLSDELRDRPQVVFGEVMQDSFESRCHCATG